MPIGLECPMSGFDLRRLFDTIDAERNRQNLSWAALGRAVGVSPSTIRPFRNASDAEADGVLALVRWLGTAPELFVEGTKGLPLAPSGQGMVRVNMELIPQGRSRTTASTL